MQLSITVNPNDPADVNAGIASLRKLLDMGQIEATFTPVQLPAVALGRLDDPSVGATPQPEKEKATRTRKPKDAVVQTGEQLKAEPAATASAPTTATSETATTSAPSASLTLDDARNALRTYTQKHNMDAGIKLLDKFGAARISELPAEKYADFVKECAA